MHTYYVCVPLCRCMCMPMCLASPCHVCLSVCVSVWAMCVFAHACGHSPPGFRTLSGGYHLPCPVSVTGKTGTRGDSKCPGQARHPLMLRAGGHASNSPGAGGTFTAESWVRAGGPQGEVRLDKPLATSDASQTCSPQAPAALGLLGSLLFPHLLYGEH